MIHNKLLIFKGYNLVHFDTCISETVVKIEIMNVSITSKCFGVPL